MAKVVHRHVSIDAVVCELIGHDSAASVVDENIQTIGRVLDLLGGFLGLGPVTQVTLDPDGAVGYFLAKFLGERLVGVVDNVFGHGEDVQLFDIMTEQNVGDAVANTLAATGHNSDLAFQAWDIVKREPSCTELFGWATKVFGNGVLLRGKQLGGFNVK